MNNESAETEIPEPEQLRLLPFDNPLKARFSGEFFRDIPNVPGVYFMLNDRGRVIYVGKAKNLRTRIASYKSASHRKSSRKTKKLIHQIDSIKWTVCSTETEALLLENELLRTVKPPLNVLNTIPETYFYILFRPAGETLQLQLTRSLNCGDLSQRVYGAFKGNAVVPRAFAALSRRLWEILHLNLDWPVTLTRVSPGRRNEFKRKFDEFGEQADLELEAYLNGESDSLSSRLFPGELETANSFLLNWWNSDSELLASFFRRGPQRTRTIKTQFGLGEGPVPQERLDDYLAMLI